MIELGISTACLYPMLTEDAVSELGRQNVKNIELFVNSQCEMEGPLLTEIKSRINHYGMNVVSLHPFTSGLETIMLFSAYERRVDEMIEYYKEYFNLMNLLGAKIFVLHGAVSNLKISNSLYFERFHRLVEVGKQFGVQVCHENVERCLGGGLDFLVEMKNSLGENAKFVLDVKQAVRRGYNPFEFLNTLGKSIAHIHISDHNENDNCLLMGKGNFNFVDFYTTLHNNGYKGSMVLEVYNNAYQNSTELSDNLKYMYKLIKHHCM